MGRAWILVEVLFLLTACTLWRRCSRQWEWSETTELEIGAVKEEREKEKEKERFPVRSSKVIGTVKHQGRR